MKEAILVSEAAPPGGTYSHAVRAGSLIFLAGCTPHRSDGAQVIGDFEEQALQAFENIRIIAEAAGSSLHNAVRVGVYLKNMDNFAHMNTLFERYFGSENAPVRTTLPVPELAFDIEIDAILEANNS